jgi:acetyltransferase-like isoleucine patch superfamily enzyme
MRKHARIVIGTNTGISGSTICAADSIRIGSDCLIGSGVMIVDNDFHAIDPRNRRSNCNHADIASAPIIIGNNVFIGAQSIILKGVSIGDNSVIGAGSVVRASIPENTIATGNPAVSIRSIEVAASL